jgi:hypothetical protein
MRVYNTCAPLRLSFCHYTFNFMMMYHYRRVFTRLLIPICVIAFACLGSGMIRAAEPSAESIPFSEIGAKATADYKGDGIGIESTTEGARLRTDLQRLVGTVTARGLRVHSTVEGEGQLQLMAAALRRGEGQRILLPMQGVVTSTDKSVAFIRPGVVEEYSVSVDGLRQDFLVMERPSGHGELSVELALTGAVAEAAAYGAKLTLVGSGRELAYSRLHVTDAQGKVMKARMEVLTKDRLALHVDDAGAAYPLRIDPTFSDADWISLNSGMPGVNAFDSSSTSAVTSVLVDGSGNLYIGGGFSFVGEVAANRVAKWNGSSWSALGSGTDNFVRSLAIVGTDLYAGGGISTAGGVAVNAIAKWDGTAWSALGSGLNGRADAMAVIGTDLYVGGQFTTADGASANYIAKWNGSAWSTFGTGANGVISAMLVVGTDLYISGAFTTINGVSANRIAKWDGSTWSALGSGLNSNVLALAASGSDIYAAGAFTASGAVGVARVAKWNGSTWSALSSGMDATVNALAVVGSDLYAGGIFTTAGGVSANRLAKWNGSAWSAVGSGADAVVRRLTVFGTTLYAAGDFYSIAGVTASGVARWDGSNWSALGSSGMNNFARAVVLSGTDLYVGGDFTMAGSVTANRIAKWNGSAWSALGSGVNGAVNALAVSGTDLYAGGAFTTAGGVTANSIAKWDGSAWSALDTGLGAAVNALAMSGTDLYAGGAFTTAGGASANYAAKWNGSAWSALGTGLGGAVNALAVSGTDLYAGGAFTTAGGASANYAAKWNGSAWSALGTGLNGQVNALAVSGIDLYAGGAFTTAGGASANYAAKWNGSAWSALGTGLNGPVNALALSGTKLFAGGAFTTAGGVSANRVAKWDTSAWSALGTGVDNTVNALATNASGHLFLGGAFTLVGTTVSPYIAEANVSEPEIAVSGNGVDISNGDATPSAGDHTDFGSQAVVIGTVVRTFTVSNTGTLALNLSGTPMVSVSGTDAADFTVTLDPTTPVATSGSTTFQITFDPSAAGTRTATVSITNDDLNENPFDFSIQGTGVPLPTVTSVSPSSGPTAGGTSVTITGTNFTGATSVTFGGTAAASFTVDSSTQITATTPAGSAGTASVLVTTPGGTNVANTLFTYVAAPTVTSVSPSSGPTAGGTSVTITGTNLTGATSVTFGGTAAASFTVDSSTQITATTPAGSAGMASVLVTTVGGTNAANALFTYNSVPTDITLTPSSIAENNAANATVGTLAAVDADAGQTHTFSLGAGTGDTDNASFTIAGTALKLTSSANYEIKSSYSLRVQADDGNGGTYAKALTVTITDVYEPPTPVILGTTGGTGGGGGSGVIDAPTADGTASLGKWESIRQGAVFSSNGHIGFRAHMELGTGTPPVTVNDFQGIWKYDGTDTRLKARSGSAAPDTGSALLDQLPLNPSISPDGLITFYGTLRIGTGAPAVTASTNYGLWSEIGGGSARLLLREGDVIVGGKTFRSGFAVTTSSANTAALNAKLSSGTALLHLDVNTPSVQLTVVAEEGQAGPGGGTWIALDGNSSDPRLSANGDLGFIGWEKVGTSQIQGIYSRLNSTAVGTSGAVVQARVGSTAPGTSGATFNAFERPTVFNGGMAFRGFLNANGDNAGGTKGQGVWAGAFGALTPVVRTGDTNAQIPTVPAGRTVSSVWSPFSNALGSLTMRVSLVGAGETRAIMGSTGGTMRIIAKVGDAAPGLAGETFTNFDHPVIGDGDQVAFTASTNTGSYGIWKQAPGGGALSLVMKAGDTISTSEGDKVVSQVSLPGSTTDDRKFETRCMDATGRLLIHVTFSDGSTSLLLGQ